MNTEQITEANQNDDLNKNFELSHIIGLNINHSKSVQCHPAMQEVIIYSVGGIIISEDLTEKNNQVFFRHGKNKINCLYTLIWYIIELSFNMEDGYGTENIQEQNRSGFL